MTAKSRYLTVDPRFELELVLDGTQDFRWRAWKEGWLSGVLAGQIVHIRQTGDVLEYRAKSDLDDLMKSYFRFSEDIDEVHKALSAVDGSMARLVNRYPYLRILRQPDPWQATVAYICSANSNIKRTSDMVERVACLSDRHAELDGDVRHAFPTPDEVLKRSTDIQDARLGLNRASGILDAATQISNSKLDLHRLRQTDVSYDEAAQALQAVTGIGPKVAACIALFSLDKAEAFPLDTWVGRALTHYYPGQSPSDLRKSFGQHAGYASQFLFRDALTRQATLTPPPSCEKLKKTP